MTRTSAPAEEMKNSAKIVPINDPIDEGRIGVIFREGTDSVGIVKIMRLAVPFSGHAPVLFGRDEKTQRFRIGKALDVIQSYLVRFL